MKIDLEQIRTILDHYAKRLALYEPLSPWEEDICISRLGLVSEFDENMQAGVDTDSPKMRALSKQIFLPLVDPHGNEQVFATKHFIWLLDLSMQRRIFRSESDLEEARRMTSAYFHDGKPFSVARWAIMMTDVLESKQLARVGEIN